MNGETMRGRLTAGTILAALLLNVALAGCGSELPDGADGKLADDWVPMAQVKAVVPEVGSCYDSRPAPSVNSFVKPVSCSEKHLAEVGHVGTFTGDSEPGTEQLAAAYAECDTKTADYLGGPWWRWRLQLHLTIPMSRAWDGGARWFRCDLVEVSAANYDEAWTERTGSLKGDKPAALLVGCANAVSRNDHIEEMTEAACSSAHNAEYIGFFRAPRTLPYPESDRQWFALYRQCSELATGYVGVSMSQWYRLSTIAWPAYPEAWAAGDRRVRCTVYFGTKKIKKTAKGTKGKGLPGF
ncbi:septum formation family protein [Catellatospora aurea]|uniref:Septum formation family protein n=1 Tax=Catellatospora aurea TaxID=1337874 RepID=A0ABW2H0D2_9ACTN